MWRKNKFNKRRKKYMSLLKDFEVIEYFLNDNNNITELRIQPKIKRPDLINNPEPLEEMCIPGWVKDQYGNYKYKLKNNKIILNNPIPSQDQLDDEKARKAMRLWYKVIKGIYKGTINSFADIKQMIINIIEGD